MLTKNGKSIFTLAIDSNNYEKDRQLKNTTGQSYNTGSLGWGSGRNVPSVLNNTYMAVGESGGNPSVDDINLLSSINVLTLVDSSSTINRTPSYEDNYLYSFSVTYKNNTAYSVVVREVGLFARLMNHLNEYVGTVLLARETISPITIQPQKTFTFTMTIG